MQDKREWDEEEKKRAEDDRNTQKKRAIRWNGKERQNTRPLKISVKSD